MDTAPSLDPERTTPSLRSVQTNLPMTTRSILNGVLARIRGPSPTITTDTTYKAFISYKHSKSRKFVTGVESALKAYAKPVLRPPIRIFRDEKHLAPGIDLPGLILSALRGSEFLVLLASPEAAQSPWVHDEVDYWCSTLARPDKMIVILIAGTIAYDARTKTLDWEHTNALPRVLQKYILQVPYYVDLRRIATVDEPSLQDPDFRHAINGIVARFRGIDPNEMIGEEVLQHRRTQRIRNAAIAALGLLTLALGAAAYLANDQREQAAQQEREARNRLAEQRAFGAFVDWDADPVKAFLQADSAFRLIPDGHPLRPTYDNMAKSLGELMPTAVANLETSVSTATFSPNLNLLAIQSVSGPPSLVDLTQARGASVNLQVDNDSSRVEAFKFSSDSRLLAGISRPRFAQAEDPFELRVWHIENGTLVGSRVLEFTRGASRPDIVGFTGDDRYVVVESYVDKIGFSAHVFAVETMAAAPARPPWRSATRFILGNIDGAAPPWRSATRFILGNIDLASGTVAQIERTAGRTLIHLLDLATGKPAVSWSPLSTDDGVRQVYLTRGRHALIINSSSAGSNEAKLISLAITTDGFRPVGGALTGPGPIFVWRASEDGAAAAVISSGADYPAELWLPGKGERISIPTSKSIRNPFVMKTGDEYRPVDLVANDQFVLTRVGIDGTELQQLLVFERDSMRLASAPFVLSLRYRAMQANALGTELATVTHDGLIERWDLLQRKFPQERPLDIAGPILGARVLGDQRLFTRSRVKQGTNYAARIDEWNLMSGQHVGQLAATFDTKVNFVVNAEGSRMATVSPAGTAYRMQLWDLRTYTSIWTTDHRAPVEAIAFRQHDTRVATIGQDETQRETVLVEYDCQTGASVETRRNVIRAGSIHLAFSADGDHIIGDYDYSSVLIRRIGEGPNIASSIQFSDAGGVPFDLGYDIIKALRNIRVEGTSLVGELPGKIGIRFAREGPGTTIMPLSSNTPVLSAFHRSNARLYPVRGSELVSPDGRWFALTTMTSDVVGASALRIYDLRSGFPVSDLKFHQVRGGPDRPWPQLLSWREQDADPIVALSFLGNDTELATVTTNGWLRRWPVPRDRWDRTLWQDPDGYAAALTGRQLVSALYVRRLSRSELAAKVAVVQGGPK
jgi:WD40 repeat protein